MLAPMRPAFAKPDITFLQGAEKPVSIDLRDSDVVDVLKFLAQKGKFNIYMSPKIQGRVTLTLENVKISDILEIVLVANSLAFYQKNSIIYVMTQEEYKARYGEDYADAREVKLMKLQYASPSQVFKMLEPTKSTLGSIVVDEQTGTLILIDTPEKVDFMSKVVEEMDQMLETRMFDLGYSKAADMQTLLNAKLGGKGVESIQADARSNQIIVTALPARMKEIEAMILSLDRKTREVSIDTKIVKINLTDRNQQGANLQYLFQSRVLSPLTVQSQMSPNLNATATSLFSQITYNELASHGFNFLMQYLQTLGESKILASPKITVIEGEEAKILIGQREAYVTTTTTTGTGGNGNTVSENVQFIDVGISLNVSAIINKNNFVTMKVKPEVSSVVRTLTTPSGNDIPIVDTTQAETRVMVKDGTTIVIGGLRKTEKANAVNQVPGVSKLPLVGRIFKKQDATLTEFELIVLLTPHVIEGDKDILPNQPLDMKGVKPYEVKAE